MNASKRLRLRSSVSRFAQQMERVLRDNDHKNGWGHCCWSYLMDCLQVEIRELILAYAYHRRGELKEDPSRIRKECVDIANFAMMIADNYGCEE